MMLELVQEILQSQDVDEDDLEAGMTIMHSYLKCLIHEKMLYYSPNVFCLLWTFHCVSFIHYIEIQLIEYHQQAIGM